MGRDMSVAATKSQLHSNVRNSGVCEACGQMYPHGCGKFDLDHRCSHTGAAHFSWFFLWERCNSKRRGSLSGGIFSSSRPGGVVGSWEDYALRAAGVRAAVHRSEVMDAITTRGAQVAVAIMAGRQTVESRRAEFRNGWYALHVSKLPVNQDQRTVVERVWPSVPQEEGLPHESVVGLVEIFRERGRPHSEHPWTGPNCVVWHGSQVKHVLVFRWWCAQVRERRISFLRACNVG